MFNQKQGDLKFPRNSVLNLGLGSKKSYDPVRWFNGCLKEKDVGINKIPAITYYQMRDVENKKAPGNKWITVENFPEAKETFYYLKEDGSLSKK